MTILNEGDHRWDHPEKIEARQRSVIDCFREATGQKTLTPGRQLWSNPGQLYDDTSGGLVAWSEYDHVVRREKLCSPSQYRVIEACDKIHAGNVKVLPSSVRCYCDDFGDALYGALRDGDFAPELIYIDATSMPERAARLLCDTMDVVNHVDGRVIVVWNVVLRYRQWRRNWDDVTSVLARSPRFPIYIRHGWSQIPSQKTIEYGTRTGMGTIIFIRESRTSCSV